MPLSVSAEAPVVPVVTTPLGLASSVGSSLPALEVHLEPHPCSLVGAAMLRRRCEKEGLWVLALELLIECKAWSAPNTISYSAAIVVTTPLGLASSVGSPLSLSPALGVLFEPHPCSLVGAVLLRRR